MLLEDVLLPTKHSICKSGPMCKTGNKGFMSITNSSIKCMDGYVGKHVRNDMFYAVQIF